MNAKGVCRLLPWDSAFFGCRIARIESSRLTPRTVPEILAWCEAQAIDCLYLLGAERDEMTDQLAMLHGFRKVDVRLTLARSLLNNPAGPVEDGAALVRESRPGDIKPLLAIARVSHGDSRFYADPGFARSRCDALYETWLLQNCQSQVHRVLVAQWEHRPVGYISFRAVDSEKGQIELLGVTCQMRGRGLGKRLVQAALCELARQGLAEVTVVTQERNTEAQRLYFRVGFQTRLVQVWYHRWFRSQRAVSA